MFFSILFVVVKLEKTLKEKLGTVLAQSGQINQYHKN
jgi:hypothetical protein